jgi:hypothetical protein
MTIARTGAVTRKLRQQREPIRLLINGSASR